MTLRKYFYLLLFLYCLGGLFFTACAQTVSADSQSTDTVNLAGLNPTQLAIYEGLDTLQVRTYFTDQTIRKYLYGELSEFYKLHSYQPAWYTRYGPSPGVEQLENALAKASDQGLVFDYHLDTLQFLQKQLFGRQSPEISSLAGLDILTTAAYLTYASHLLSGFADPNQFDGNWIAQPRSKNLARHLRAALQSGKIEESLTQLLPAHPQYHRLKESLERYRKLAKNGGWPSFAQDALLRKGDTSGVVIQLRQRLAITGDLPENGTSTVSVVNSDAISAENPVEIDPLAVLDESVAAGLARYQARNGLIADSILGTNTLQMLNVPVEERVRQIQLNMERLRWWPRSFGEKYVLVNVPEYKLRVYENQEKQLEMKVIVGKEYHSTPIFRDMIRYIEFSPTWVVPRSIAVNEILPAIQKDSTYLTRNQMKLYPLGQVKEGAEIDPYLIDWASISDTTFRYQIVQQPGPRNALGQIKFMFPNKLAIYLHDTPAGYLFDRKRRAYSHGCVRVEEPVELAAFLLKEDPAWNRQRIRENMHQPEPVVKHLPEPVPVQFLYQTAFVDEEGQVNFRPDIYGHDSKQTDAIMLE